MKYLGRIFITTALFMFSLSLLTARADDDPPGRVARLQFMSGSVSVQPGGNEDWVQGTLNTPLTNSDNIWTDKESKAELNVGGGILRMNSESSLTLTNVDNRTVQVELHQGTLNLHVSHLFDGEIYEVDTPNVAFTVQKAGDYRFDADPDGDTTVITVRKGEGDATGNGPGVRIKSNEQMSFNNGNSLEHTVAEAPAFDGFDSWCGARDKREDESVSARYVSPGVIGSEDLDDNGVWNEIPPYGPVWTPTHVAAGWAPYRDGHWAWVSPWGWTWVDDAPWGFAPFHYGRWVYYGSSWGWVPGPIYAAPVYAPALVAWFGGGGWGVSVGFGAGGGFGWCPLGWREPFYPWYNHGYGYFRNVNITNTHITNINNYYGHPPNRFDHYANYRAPGAFTAVPSRTLQSGLSVQRTAVHLNPNQMGNVPVARTVGVTPNRGAVLGVNSGRASAVPPSRSFSRPVVSRNGVPGRMNSPAMSQNNVFRPNGNPTFRTSNGTMQDVNRVQGTHANGVNTSPIARNVPRPPNASTSQGGFANARGGNESSPRFTGNSMGTNSRNNVPRPPNASSTVGGVRSSNGNSSRLGRNSGNNDFSRTSPRPVSGATPANGSRSMDTFNRGDNGNARSVNVPRPSGPVRSASQVANEGGSRSYGSPTYSRGTYGSGSYTTGARGGSMPNYSGSAKRGYSPSVASRGAYSPQPSYRGGGYSSGPSYGSRGASPSYGGGSPSYRASAPSYHGSSGGFGGGSSRGGYSGGGGGGHSAGGGHASGGGHSGGHR